MRDFLASLKLECTSSVFTEEVGISSENRVDRLQLSSQLGLEVVDNQGDVPLLLILIQNLLAQKKTRDAQYNTALLLDRDF